MWCQCSFNGLYESWRRILSGALPSVMLGNVQPHCRCHNMNPAADVSTSVHDPDLSSFMSNRSEQDPSQITDLRRRHCEDWKLNKV